MRGPLVSLAWGLLAVLVAAGLIVPMRAWASAVLPILVTAAVGGLVMWVVARRRPDEGAPDHDPFGLLGDRIPGGDPTDATTTDEDQP